MSKGPNRFNDKIIQAEEVAVYLNENRDFFHVFPQLLDELSVPHPQTGRSISLLEKQIYQLRTQRDRLQVEVDSLKDIAGENGQLLQKVYGFSYALMSAKTEAEAVSIIYQQMQDVFAVEQVALVSWEIPSQSIEGLSQLGFSQAWSKSLKEALQPKQTVCGLVENEWQNGLFSTKTLMQSVCVLPLGEKRVWGALALGATSNRFSPELGTYFLNIMANLITARLQRLFCS